VKVFFLLISDRQQINKSPAMKSNSGNLRPLSPGGPTAQGSYMARTGSSYQPKDDRLDFYVRAAVQNIDMFRQQARSKPRPKITAPNVTQLYNAVNDMFTIIMNRFAMFGEANNSQEVSLAQAREIFPLSLAHGNVVESMVLAGGPTRMEGLRFGMYDVTPLNATFDPTRSESEARAANLAMNCRNNSNANFRPDNSGSGRRQANNCEFSPAMPPTVQPSFQQQNPRARNQQQQRPVYGDQSANAPVQYGSNKNVNQRNRRQSNPDNSYRNQ